MCELFSIIGKVTNRALVPDDLKAHIIDLRLNILGFIHWFFQCFGECVSFFRTELIDEMTSVTVTIDMVLEDLWHLMVTVTISSSELFNESFRH